MPLNWNVAKCENYMEFFNEEENMKQPYSSIVMATMIVGMNEITEQNYEQFYKRINLAERVGGCYVFTDGKPSYITLEEVKRMIGLHTNASRLTAMQFLKRIAPEGI